MRNQRPRRPKSSAARRCRVWTVATSKGGAGKTTLTANLAVEALRRDLRVLVIDSDPQGSLSVWHARAQRPPDEGQRPRLVPALSRMSLERALHGPMNWGGDYDLVLIDTPARIGEVLTHAFYAADLCIVPCPADAFDPNAQQEFTIPKIREVQADRQQSKRPELRAVLLVTRYRPTPVEQALLGELPALGLPLLQHTIGERSAYKQANLLGDGVTRLCSGRPAAQEVRAVFDELWRMS